MIGGVIGSIPFNIWAGVFITGFALYLGASNVDIGLLGTIPVLAGIAQPLASYWAESTRMTRKFITNIFYALSVILWIPIILLPFWDKAPGYSLFIFFSCFTLFNFLISMTNPPYISWLGDVVPDDIRGRYFSRRNMWAGLSGMSVSLIMGKVVDILPKKVAFPLVFSVAIFFCIVEIIIIFLQPEPYKEPRRDINLLKEFSLPLKDKNFFHYTLFIALWNFGVIMPGQFFSVFNLKYLNLSYTTIVLVGTFSGVAGLLAQPLFGYLADRYPNKTILLSTSFLASFIPAFYIFMDPRHPLFSLILLYAVNIVAGAIWAGITLTQFNLLLALSPPIQRMSYVGIHSAFISLTGASSPFIGGLIVNALKHFNVMLPLLELTNIKVLFLISTTIRLLSLVLLKVVKEGRTEESPLQLVRDVMPRRPLEVIRALRMLASGAEEEKIKAIRRLGALRSALAVDNLFRLLEDANPEVRREAIMALGKIDGESVVENLRKYLGKERRNNELIVEVLKKLGAINIDEILSGVSIDGEEFPNFEKMDTEELRKILEEERDEERVAFLCYLLAKRGAKEALEDILKAGERIATPLYRRQWVYSLGKLLGLNIYPFLALDHLELYQRVENLLREVERKKGRTRLDIRLAIRYFGEGEYQRFVQRLAKSLNPSGLDVEKKRVVEFFLNKGKISAEEAVLSALCLLKVSANI